MMEQTNNDTDEEDELFDEIYNEEEYEEYFNDEERIKELYETADHMFENGVWQNSKNEMKEMSKRESCLHMFRLGFLMHDKNMDSQMRYLLKRLDNKSEEEQRKILDELQKRFNKNK